jgi:hypothetical protein
MKKNVTSNKTKELNKKYPAIINADIIKGVFLTIKDIFDVISFSKAERLLILISFYSLK